MLATPASGSNYTARITRLGILSHHPTLTNTHTTEVLLTIFSQRGVSLSHVPVSVSRR
jgi:hypothetical protein